jgi:hypothetical protein
MIAGIISDERILYNDELVSLPALLSANSVDAYNNIPTTSFGRL